MDPTRRALALLPWAGLIAACTARTSSGPESAARTAAVLATLPEPMTGGDIALEQALAQRRSVRSFTSRGLSRAQVGQLMWAAQGVTHGPGYRTAPSAGALYPLELYAITRTSVLHYRPDGHRAEEWAPVMGWQALLDATSSADAVATAPAAFVIAGVAGRTVAKYGTRSAQYVHLEAGHAAQNLLLQAIVLGLGAVTIGAFSEDRIARFLALPTSQTPLYLVPVGYPAPPP